jgi:hypothetical protein
MLQPALSVANTSERRVEDPILLEWGGGGVRGPRKGEMRSDYEEDGGLINTQSNLQIFSSD